MSLKALGGFIGDNEFLGMHNPLWRTIRRRKSGFKWEETAQRRRRKRVAGGLYLKDLVQVGIGYHQLIFFLVWLNFLIAWNSWVNGPFPILITFYDPIIHLRGILEQGWTGNLFREINLKGAVRNYSAIHTTVKYHHQRSFELDSNDQLFSWGGELWGFRVGEGVGGKEGLSISIELGRDDFANSLLFSRM